jgi:hypothetical protein
VRAEISLRFCRSTLLPGTGYYRTIPCDGAALFLFLSLAGSQDCPKNCICSELSKDIHNVSLRPCQEKFFAFNEQPAIFEPLKHTSNDTLELDHDACPTVNSFTPNSLILTIFNESGCDSAGDLVQGATLSITWGECAGADFQVHRLKPVLAHRLKPVPPQIRSRCPAAWRPVSFDSA